MILQGLRLFLKNLCPFSRESACIPPISNLGYGSGGSRSRRKVPIFLEYLKCKAKPKPS